MDGKVEDLLRRRTEIVAGGGEAKVEGQHRKGKKTALCSKFGLSR